MGVSAELLSRWKFRLFWVLILLAHMYCIAYLLVFAAFHLVLNTQSYFVRQLAVETNLIFVAVIYVVSSGLHVHRLGAILYNSIRYRALQFECESKPKQKPKQLELKSLKPAIAILSETTQQKWTLCGATKLWKKYLERSGIFGIFGTHGDIRIWCIECLNLGAHLFQASRWSILTRLMAMFAISVLLACECLYPAVFHRFSGNTSRSKRARVLLVDIVIDTLLCVLIPSWLVALFVWQYLADPHVVNSNFSETWYAEGVLTLKQSLATTPLDLITKLSPFYFNYMSLVEISSGAHLPVTSYSPLAVVPDSEWSNQWLSSIRFHPEPVLHSDVPLEVTRQQVRNTRLKKIWFSLMRLVFASFGLVFVLMVLASSGALKPVPLICREGCFYVTTPWLLKRCNCIVQELNCAKLNITGSDGVQVELEGYSKDEYTVVLILNGCKGLVIPKSIQNLPNLLGLYVYASELIEWGEDAALTSDAFASISYIVFVNTTLSEIPTGLLTNLAPTVQDIEIIASSTPLALPDSLHEKWPTVETLYLERCNLVTFPEPLPHMENLEQLSLAGNSIADLPESLFTSPLFKSLGYLILSANPSLTHLPPNLDAATSLLVLYVDATRVTELHLASLDKTSSDLKVSAAQSPVCESGSVSSNSTSGSARVSCDGLYGGMYTLGVYPLLPEQRVTRNAKFLPDDRID